MPTIIILLTIFTIARTFRTSEATSLMGARKMRVYRRHNQELGRTEPITLDGVSFFTTPVELANYSEVSRSTFQGFPGFTRTFSLRFYGKTQAGIVSGDNGRLTTAMIFSTKSAASREYEAIIARYRSDPRWAIC